MASAYVICEVEIVDRALADRYRELAAASIAKFGGRYLARGAAPKVIEGQESRGAIRKHCGVPRSHGVGYPHEDRWR
jgi:uncharacterized protein (DUF1330 family)